MTRLQRDQRAHKRYHLKRVTCRTYKNWPLEEAIQQKIYTMNPDGSGGRAILGLSNPQSIPSGRMVQMFQHPTAGSEPDLRQEEMAQKERGHKGNLLPGESQNNLIGSRVRDFKRIGSGNPKWAS